MKVKIRKYLTFQKSRILHLRVEAIFIVTLIESLAQDNIWKTLERVIKFVPLKPALDLHITLMPRQ